MRLFYVLPLLAIAAVLPPDRDSVTSRMSLDPTTATLTLEITKNNPQPLAQECSTSAPQALLYVAGDESLEEPFQEWVGFAIKHNYAITATRNAEDFESLYETREYALVAAFTNTADQINRWQTRVPRESAFNAISAVENNLVLRSRVFVPSCPTGLEATPPELEEAPAPTSEPGVAANVAETAGTVRGPIKDLKDWLKRVVPCVQNCTATFLNALPDDVQLTASVTFQTTPPGMSTTITVSGTKAQLQQFFTAYFDYLACLRNCI